MSLDQPPTQRDFDALTRALNAVTSELRAMPDKIAETYVRKDVLNPQLESIRATLATHNGWFTWIVRTVGAVIVVGLIGLLLSGGVHYGGNG